MSEPTDNELAARLRLMADGKSRYTDFQCAEILREAASRLEARREISEAMVERGAIVLQARAGILPWERETEEGREAYRKAFRAALEATLKGKTS